MSVCLSLCAQQTAPAGDPVQHDNSGPPTVPSFAGPSTRFETAVAEWDFVSLGHSAVPHCVELWASELRQAGIRTREALTRVLRRVGSLSLSVCVCVCVCVCV